MKLFKYSSCTKGKQSIKRKVFLIILLEGKLLLVKYLRSWKEISRSLKKRLPLT